MCMYALMQPIEEFEAKLIRGAMQTKNSKILTQLVCTKETYEINALKESFQKCEKLFLSHFMKNLNIFYFFAKFSSVQSGPTNGNSTEHKRRL